jgi:malate dehydrogenase (quinone)
MLGEAKINPGTGIIFNMTPSPGATSCLDNAVIDMKLVAQKLGATVDEQRLEATLRS